MKRPMNIYEIVSTFHALVGLGFLGASALLWGAEDKALKPIPKSGTPVITTPPATTPIPRNRETKIEHVIREKDGQREEVWYVYVYVSEPGWFLRSAHDKAESAIWQKQWSDDLYFNEPKEILRETLQ